MANKPLIKPLGMREPAVIEQVGSTALYRAMRADRWLVPVVNRHRLVLFDSGDVAKAWARIVSGELPQSMQPERVTA